jgi:excisionase family DNA binding protein
LKPTDTGAMKMVNDNDIIQPVSGAGNTTEPELERKPQFARRASVSVRCVDNWIRDRRIPFLKIGRAVLIPWREALDTLNHKYRMNARGE